MENLEDIRKQIDAIDAQLAPLFEQRMELSRRISEYKRTFGLSLRDVAREEEIIRRGVRWAAPAPLDPSLSNTCVHQIEAPASTQK